MRRWLAPSLGIGAALGLAWLMGWIGGPEPAPSDTPSPTGVAADPHVDPTEDSDVSVSQRAGVVDPEIRKPATGAFETIRVSVVNHLGETLHGARVEAWARRASRDAVRESLPSIEPEPESDEDAEAFAFLCPSDAELVEFEATCPRREPRRDVRTLGDARRGTRIVLFESGRPIVHGRLLDARRQPWPREALERWFGRAQHQAWTMSLVTIRGSDAQAFGGANVDFDSAEFTAVVSRGFDGEVALLDGSRKAAFARWRDGDAPVELIFDPHGSLADRARLTVRLEPAPVEAVVWRMRRVSPWTTEPFTEVSTDDWIQTAAGEWIAASIPEGTYVLRCERQEEEEILAAKSIVVRPRDDLSVTLTTRSDVPVEIRLSNDDPLGARHDDGHGFEVGVTDDDGCSWGEGKLELDRDGVTRLTGSLPVGSWWLHAEGAAAHVVVDRSGRVDPSVVTFTVKQRARLRVGPCEAGTRENGGRWVKALVFTATGHFVDDQVVSSHLDAAGFMPLEVPLPPFPVRIHVTARSFAEPTIVDVDPRAIDDRVIDVVLR